jgi:hypothetical protein
MMDRNVVFSKFKQRNDEETEWQIEFKEALVVGDAGKRLYRFRVSRLVRVGRRWKRRGFRLAYSTRLHRCAQGGEFMDMGYRFSDVWTWAQNEIDDWVAVFGVSDRGDDDAEQDREAAQGHAGGSGGEVQPGDTAEGRA